jgi:hypothetical protein
MTFPPSRGVALGLYGLEHGRNGLVLSADGAVYGLDREGNRDLLVASLPMLAARAAERTERLPALSISAGEAAKVIDCRLAVDGKAPPEHSFHELVKSPLSFSYDKRDLNGDPILQLLGEQGSELAILRRRGWQLYFWEPVGDVIIASKPLLSKLYGEIMLPLYVEPGSSLRHSSLAEPVLA